MHKKIFPTPAFEAKHRAGLLGAYFDCFLGWMQEHGYSCYSMRPNIQRVTNFGKYLELRGIHSIHQLEGVQGKKLLATYRDYWKANGYSNGSSGLQYYIRALEEAGVLGSSAPRASSLFHETEQYIAFLKNQRGLSESTIYNHKHWVEKFLRFLGCQNSISSLPSFGIAHVDRFIEQESVRLKRNSQQTLVGPLKSFLQFLYQSEKLTTDLSCLVTNPRCYRLESLPHVLNWDEVRKIIYSVDHSTKLGLRNYAILILLTTYGLRAGEVAHLKLEDIDWRKETIHITVRKAGKDLWLPLIPKVGKAIVEYLKYARSASKPREIFLNARAPCNPLSSRNVTRVVNRHIQLAGLNPPRHGAHLLRHSFATHLIRRSVPLKQIADLLGHQDLESTHIYTKTATERLQEVALEVPDVR